MISCTEPAHSVDEAVYRGLDLIVGPCAVRKYEVLDLALRSKTPVLNGQLVGRAHDLDLKAISDAGQLDGIVVEAAKHPRGGRHGGEMESADHLAQRSRLRHLGYRMAQGLA